MAPERQGEGLQQFFLNSCKLAWQLHFEDFYQETKEMGMGHEAIRDYSPQLKEKAQIDLKVLLPVEVGFLQCHKKKHFFGTHTGG